MTLDLDRLRGRAAAIGLLLALLVLTVNAIVVPAELYLRDGGSEREHSLHQLTKLRALVDATPAMKQALERIDAHPVWQRLYPAGGGSAALQQDFRNLVEAQGIKLDSVEPRDPEPVDDFQKLTLRVTFSTTIDHLARLQLAMRAAPRLLRFENLGIAAASAHIESGNPILSVRGDLVGYSQGAAAP